MTADVLVQNSRRILVIDDNPRIHADIRKIFGPAKPAPGDEETRALFPEPPGGNPGLGFDLTIDSAHQGLEGLDLVAKAIAEGRPYLMAFVDMRMPPGWDGIKTIQNIWKICPALQVVICTAYSDKPWHEINAELGGSANLLILKKPFDPVEVLQLVQTLTCKWIVTRIAECRMGELEVMLEERTFQMIKANEELKVESEQRSVAQQAWLEAEDRFQQTFGRLGGGAGRDINISLAAITRQLVMLQQDRTLDRETIAALRALQMDVERLRFAKARSGQPICVRLSPKQP